MVGLFGEWKNFGDVLRIFKWIGIGLFLVPPTLKNHLIL
jgi:hypothetical protein